MPELAMMPQMQSELGMYEAYDFSTGPVFIQLGSIL
jgi:hypothetical protein